MHWSTARALTTIAQHGHTRLDQELADAIARDDMSDPYLVEAAADPTFHGGWRVSVTKTNGQRISLAADGEAAAVAKLPWMREFATLMAEKDRLLDAA